VKSVNEDSRLPPAPPGYLLSINVDARADSTEPAKVSALEQKLAQAKLFTGRAYLVNETIVSPLLKKRSEFVKDTATPGN